MYKYLIPFSCENMIMIRIEFKNNNDIKPNTKYLGN